MGNMGHDLFMKEFQNGKRLHSIKAIRLALSDAAPAKLSRDDMLRYFGTTEHELDEIVKSVEEHPDWDDERILREVEWDGDW